ncbi:hypothetical protein B0H13DRAFT_1647959, partial [Mycena leptocephala]
AAGYIGGPILSRFLERQDPDLNITALVRSIEKAEKLRGLNLPLNIVTGSHNDADLVERLAADADVVFSLADCDNLQAAESILRGLKQRFSITGIKPVLIHMVSTATSGRQGHVLFATVYNDTDIAQIETLPATQPHRNVDLAIVEADTQGYTDTYIVLPGIVYGTPHGVLAKAGVQNPTNLALTGYLKASFARGAAGIMGDGKNLISHADVTEVADQVEAVYDAVAAKRAPGHGRDGYYFVANGDVAFSEVVAIVETRAGARRVFTQAELTAYSPPSVQDFFGDNGRCDSQRSRELGWKPVKTTVDFLDAVRDEVEHWTV